MSLILNRRYIDFLMRLDDNLPYVCICLMVYCNRFGIIYDIPDASKGCPMDTPGDLPCQEQTGVPTLKLENHEMGSS